MTDPIASIRTAFPGDREAQVEALARKRWSRDPRRPGMPFDSLPPSNRIELLACAAHLLFPHSPAEIAESGREAGVAGQQIIPTHNGGDIA